jgi:hypothetical protein
MFFLPVCYIKTQRLKYTRLKNFACSFVLVQIFVSCIDGGTKPEGFQENCAKENIWT